MKKKLLSLVMSAVLSIGLLGAMGTSVAASDGDYDLYIFNTKGENADALRAAADAFQEEKGVTVKVFSLGSGTDSSETMRTEMTSKNKPAIFCCMNATDLVEWVEGGFAMDLTKATNEDFLKLVSEIPENFYLTLDGSVNYGVPFNVEGYGYIVSKTMLADLFF